MKSTLKPHGSAPRAEHRERDGGDLASSALSSLAFGAGTLAFLLWPMLIPGVGLETAVMDSCAVALVGYIGLCLWGVYRCLRRPPRHRPVSRHPRP